MNAAPCPTGGRAWQLRGGGDVYKIPSYKVPHTALYPGNMFANYSGPTLVLIYHIIYMRLKMSRAAGTPAWSVCLAQLRSELSTETPALQTNPTTVAHALQWIWAAARGSHTGACCGVLTGLPGGAKQPGRACSKGRAARTAGSTATTRDAVRRSTHRCTCFRRHRGCTATRATQ